MSARHPPHRRTARAVVRGRAWAWLGAALLVLLGAGCGGGPAWPPRVEELPFPPYVEAEPYLEYQRWLDAYEHPQPRPYPYTDRNRAIFAELQRRQRIAQDELEHREALREKARHYRNAQFDGPWRAIQERAQRELDWRREQEALHLERFRRLQAERGAEHLDLQEQTAVARQRALGEEAQRERATLEYRGADNERHLNRLARAQRAQQAQVAAQDRARREADAARVAPHLDYLVRTQQRFEEQQQAREATVSAEQRRRWSEHPRILERAAHLAAARGAPPPQPPAPGVEAPAEPAAAGAPQVAGVPQ